MKVEVCLGSVRRTLGVAYDSDTKLEDMRASLRVLDLLGEESLFRLSRRAHCAYEFHFHSRDDWHLFVEKPTAGPILADGDLIDEALSRDDGHVVLTEESFLRLYARGDGR